MNQVKTQSGKPLIVLGHIIELTIRCLKNETTGPNISSFLFIVHKQIFKNKFFHDISRSDFVEAAECCRPITLIPRKFQVAATTYFFDNNIYTKGVIWKVQTTPI